MSELPPDIDAMKLLSFRRQVFLAFLDDGDGAILEMQQRALRRGPPSEGVRVPEVRSEDAEDGC